MELELPQKSDIKLYRDFTKSLFLELRRSAITLAEGDELIADIVVTPVILKIDSDFERIKAETRDIMKYSHRCLRNAFVDYLRSGEYNRNARINAEYKDDITDDSASLANQTIFEYSHDEKYLIDDAKIAIIRTYITTLSDQDIHLFNLFFKEYLSNKKIAEIIGKPVSQVENIKKKFRNKIRAIAQKELKTKKYGQ